MSKIHHVASSGEQQIVSLDESTRRDQSRGEGGAARGGDAADGSGAEGASGEAAARRQAGAVREEEHDEGCSSEMVSHTR